MAVVYFEFKFGPNAVSNNEVEGFMTLLQPKPRGRFRHFGFTLGELSRRSSSSTL